MSLPENDKVFHKAVCKENASLNFPPKSTLYCHLHVINDRFIRKAEIIGTTIGETMSPSIVNIKGHVEDGIVVMIIVSGRLLICRLLSFISLRTTFEP